MHLFPMLAAGSLLLTVAALADEPIVRQAGEWQVTTIGPGGKANPPRSISLRTSIAGSTVANSAASEARAFSVSL
jgi:hypothetical protein